MKEWASEEGKEKGLAAAESYRVMILKKKRLPKKSSANKTRILPKRNYKSTTKKTPVGVFFVVGSGQSQVLYSIVKIIV